MDGVHAPGAEGFMTFHDYGPMSPADGRSLFKEFEINPLKDFASLKLR